MAFGAHGGELLPQRSDLAGRRIHAGFKHGEPCVAVLGRLIQAADRAEHVLQRQGIGVAELSRLRGERLALCLRRTDRAFDRDRNVAQLGVHALRHDIGRTTETPWRQVSVVQPLDVGRGQCAMLRSDVVGGCVEGGVAAVLVGEPEFEVARLERQARGAQFLNDHIAGEEAGLGTRGRHSVVSTVAVCG